MQTHSLSRTKVAQHRSHHVAAQAPQQRMLLRALAATQRSPFLSRGLIRRSLISRSVATREMVEEESRQTESLSTESSLLTPQHRPIYHLQPRSAWLNDPNGVHWDPRSKLYHMFYQHSMQGAVWQWNLVWGHAVSEDLLRWHHLAPAVHPTPGGVDADGVWSGCAFPTEDGTVLLNTAVVQRVNARPDQVPPPELDLGLQMIERQTYATADTSDPLLRTWTKGAAPFLPLPPTGGLTGWRDPFLVGRPGDGAHTQYTILIGSGYSPHHTTPHPATLGTKAGAGTAFVYTSDHPTSGWELKGELCVGDGHTGSMWECPLLSYVPMHPSPLTAAVPPPSPCKVAATAAVAGLGSLERSATAPPAAAAHTAAAQAAVAAAREGLRDHVFVVCPDNAHHAPVYWLGQYDAQDCKFALDKASGPYPLDLGGPTFYAPNLLMNDPHGRLVMYGWCQELGRPEGEYDSACCLSLPRVLWRHPANKSRLWQEPLVGLDALRMSNGGWASDRDADTSGNVRLTPGQPFDIPATEHRGHMEIEVTFTRPVPHRHRKRTTKVGLVLPPSPAALNRDVPVGEASGRHGAALMYEWETGRLEMVYTDGTVPIHQLAGLPSVHYRAMNTRSKVHVEGEDHPHYHLDKDGLVESDTEDEESDEEVDVDRRALNIEGCHAVGGVLRPLSAHAKHAHTNGSGSSTGGPVRGSVGEQLTLRVFVDASLVEAFTSTGEVLTARVHRDPPSLSTHTLTHPQPCGPLQLVCFGSPTTATHVAVHHMNSIWEAPEALADLELRARVRAATANKPHTITTPPLGTVFTNDLAPTTDTIPATNNSTTPTMSPTKAGAVKGKGGVASGLVFNIVAESQSGGVGVAMAAALIAEQQPKQGVSGTQSTSEDASPLRDAFEGLVEGLAGPGLSVA